MELGGASGTYEGEKKCVQDIGGENWDHLESLGVTEWVILKRILKKQHGLAWNEFMCNRITINGRVAVNTKMKLQI